MERRFTPDRSAACFQIPNKWLSYVAVHAAATQTERSPVAVEASPSRDGRRGLEARASAPRQSGLPHRLALRAMLGSVVSAAIAHRAILPKLPWMRLFPASMTQELGESVGHDLGPIGGPKKVLPIGPRS